MAKKKWHENWVVNRAYDWGKPKTPLFWWNERPNLGDVLTGLLLRARGMDPVWAPVDKATWVGIGSVLEWFDAREVTVWGSGRAGPHAPITDLRNARVLALRGMLTRELVAGSLNCPLGDPGLLAYELVPPSWESYTAIVPHWQDQERMQATYPTAEFVDVTGDPMEAIAKIAGAERVIASAFHGIVVADAYGIPRMWDWFDGIQAGGFKFRDYATVVGAFDPGEWKKVPYRIVHETREGLRACLAM